MLTADEKHVTRFDGLVTVVHVGAECQLFRQRNCGFGADLSGQICKLLNGRHLGERSNCQNT
jgi:hypothetical protein